MTLLQAFFQVATSGAKMQSGLYVRCSEVGFAAVWFGGYGCCMRFPNEMFSETLHFVFHQVNWAKVPKVGKHSP